MFAQETIVNARDASPRPGEAEPNTESKTSRQLCRRWPPAALRPSSPLQAFLRGREHLPEQRPRPQGLVPENQAAAGDRRFLGKLLPSRPPPSAAGRHPLLPSPPSQPRMDFAGVLNCSRGHTSGSASPHPCPLLRGSPCRSPALGLSRVLQPTRKDISGPCHTPGGGHHPDHSSVSLRACGAQVPPLGRTGALWGRAAAAPMLGYSGRQRLPGNYR